MLSDCKLVLIAAVARNRVIGYRNCLPWRLPEDLQRFRALTVGHAVLMGRKTWESLPERFRPLPERLNVVISRNLDFKSAGASVAHSVQQACDVALKVCRGSKTAMAADSKLYVIGGSELFAAVMPLATRMELTEIEADFAGDAFFPEFDRASWLEIKRQPVKQDGLCFSFVSYQRK